MIPFRFKTFSRAGALALALGVAIGWTMPRTAAYAAEPTPEEMASAIAKIKEEGDKRSQVMKIAEHLTEVIGPRLTNSPEMTKANEWTRDQMKEWGMENAKLEPWGEFGRGWSLKRFSAQIVEPQCIPLTAIPYAWSPGTNGPITAPVVRLEGTTAKDLEKYKGKLKGAFVLLGGPAKPIKAHFEADGDRYDDSELLRLANASPPGSRSGAGGNFRRQGGAGGNAAGITEEMRARFAEMAQRSQALRTQMTFAQSEEVAALLRLARDGDGGEIFVESASVSNSAPGGPLAIGGGARSGPWSANAKVIPQIALSTEHYNRLVRLLDAKQELKATIDLQVQFHDADLKAYNTVAEIPGTDLKDEVVMLGGHMDSWHGGTGATDNASGVAVCMEAARIIKTLDLKPRRTIRVALWSGEEQGLMGSRGYVAEHFAKRGDNGELVRKPEHETFSGYFNLDNGTGKIRGIYLQGNEACRPIFRDFLAPFADMGASTVASGNTSGTDHQSFDGVGLPGFQFIQDPIEYDSRTHHSNHDTFDRLQADDLRQASVIMAAFVYQTAMRGDKLPRKPAASSGDGPRSRGPRGPISANPAPAPATPSAADGKAASEKAGAAAKDK